MRFAHNSDYSTSHSGNVTLVTYVFPRNSGKCNDFKQSPNCDMLHGKIIRNCLTFNHDPQTYARLNFTAGHLYVCINKNTTKESLKGGLFRLIVFQYIHYQIHLMCV